MKHILSLALITVMAVQSTASAGTDDFSFTADGGDIPDDAIGVFPLFMRSELIPQVPIITSIELDITGLTHTDPWDLDIYLIDPFGNPLEIMTDRGDRVGITNVNLTFADGASGLPPENTELLSDTYLPEGPGGFAQYIGGSGGTDAWILVVIDDSPDDTGGFQNFTLHGTFVPEPVTLSLLALGALVTLRRKRRR